MSLLNPLRRRVLHGMGLAMLSASSASSEATADSAPMDGVWSLPPTKAVWRIGFGSCAKASKSQPIWNAVSQQSPDLFVFLGDNFYVDSSDPGVMAQRHEEFREHPEASAFRRRIPHIAIWDDHDYGLDDAGAEFTQKALSQQQFCTTWNVPEGSARCQRQGLYGAYWLRSQGRAVQVLLLDVRYHRSPLVRDPRAADYADLIRRGLSGSAVPGWYLPNPDPQATLLGAAQWEWLERQMAQPADLRILASPIQLAAEGTGWECWAHFPRERDRLAHLLSRRSGGAVMAISGDMHYGEISRWTPGQPQESDTPPLSLWDITSSGLTETWTIPTPNHRRVHGPYTGRNFGILELNWHTGRWTARIHDEQGRVRLAQHDTLAGSALPGAST